MRSSPTCWRASIHCLRVVANLDNSSYSSASNHCIIILAYWLAVVQVQASRIVLDRMIVVPPLLESLDTLLVAGAFLELAGTIELAEQFLSQGTSAGRVGS